MQMVYNVSIPRNRRGRIKPKFRATAVCSTILLWFPSNCILSAVRTSQSTRMPSSALRPLARRFPFPRCTTNHNDYPRQIDPVYRIEDLFAVKSGLYGVRVVEQACMVISPTSYPVLHYFPIVRADIRHGFGDDRPIVSPRRSFRRPRTDGTRPFEVVCLHEVLLTLVRLPCRVPEYLERRQL
ncbi:hypothetical protein EI94DRAFT_592099 [Lactarius quietus]|nr:hypothetical protein EI94DRAFT_592099 [Lactarius quietus]